MYFIKKKDVISNVVRTPKENIKQVRQLIFFPKYRAITRLLQNCNILISADLHFSILRIYAANFERDASDKENKQI